MNAYQFALTVADFDLDDDFQNAAIEAFDYVAVVGRTAGITQVDVEIEAESAERALARVIADLRGIGVTTRRVDLDLVNTSEIADRLGKSRETVRLWSTGGRRQGFPTPYAVVADSQVWAWSDVYNWATENGVEVEDVKPIPVDVAESFTGAVTRARAIAWRGWATRQIKVQTGQIPRAVVFATSQAWSARPAKSAA